MPKNQSTKPKCQTIRPSVLDTGVDLLRKDELAARLKLSERWVDYAIAGRKIPYIKLGRLVRFRLVDVERALKRYTVEEVTLS